MTLLNSEFWNDVTKVSNWYLPSPYGEWELLEEFSIKDDYWVPVFVPDEPQKLVVSSRIGRDTYAMFKYDAAQRKMGELMAGHPDQDILGASGVDQGAFQRVSTRGMRMEQVWFDPVWSKVQATIDAELPNRVNVLSGNPNGKVLVYSYGDTDPGHWYC